MNVINLTTGLEWNIEADSYSRLQSSHLESKAWQKFIDSVDDNILYNLARGNDVNIYDTSSRNLDGISRVVWQGIPFIKYTLERTWELPQNKPFFKGHNVARLLNDLYNQLNKKRIRYYSKFVCTDTVRLNGYSKRSLLDGKI